MSDLCPQCGGPAYAPSNQCNVIWHTGAKPFGTSVVQDIEAQLAEQIEWVKRLADDLIAAEGREARLKDKLAKALEALEFYAEADNYEDQHKPESCGCCYYLHDAEIKEDEGAKARATLAELTGGKDD